MWIRASLGIAAYAVHESFKEPESSKFERISEASALIEVDRTFEADRIGILSASLRTLRHDLQRSQP